MIHGMDQRTEAWFRARMGKATASRVADVVARTKSGYSTSRANYAAQLVCERLTGVQAESFSSAAMAWGTEKEPDARAAYSFRMDVDVEEVGFVDHPMLEMAGASPDGLIGGDGLLEIKCPISATHINTLLNDAIPDGHLVQMQWQIACCGRQWCDYVSYDPRLPEQMQLYVKRVPRDPERIAFLEMEVDTFLAEVGATVSRLRSRYPEGDQAWRSNVLLAG